MNLVANACDALARGGEVVVRTGGNADEVWLEVKDTGTGIPAEIRDRIFEPFFTTKGSGKGTGLGLAVVHGIVTNHRGRLELDSRPGEGATFRVVLPRAAASSPGRRETSGSIGRTLAPGHGRRVVLVEDEDGARRVLAELLALLGFAVDSAASAEEATKLLDAGPVHLLVTDYRLPAADGLWLAAEARRRCPSLPVIVMSGYAEEHVAPRGLEGQYRFLQKPFDPETLGENIRALLDHGETGLVRGS